MREGSWKSGVSSSFARIAGLLVLLCRSWSPTRAFVPWNTASFRVQHNKRITPVFSRRRGEEPEFYIRKALYQDLGEVADIIMRSFYTTTQAPWRQMYRLGELNRLQQNFPYNDEQHSMFVAVSQQRQDMVVGFVDVDARPSKRPYDPPRPYLSDLAVDPRWRRKGVARHLIHKCEYVARDEMEKPHLYIRVEHNNTVAISMYTGLNYEALQHEYFGVKDTTMLLKKSFEANHMPALDNANEGETMLDYVL